MHLLGISEMKTAICILSALAGMILHVASSTSIDAVADEEGSEMERIVGGRDAAPGQFPYAAALYRNGEFWCTSSIIGERTVLTAAHCVVINGTALAPDRFYAIANVKKSSPTIRIVFASLTAHPQYDERTIKNDVAVFRTTAPIPFDDNVKPICIPRSGSTYPRDNEKAIAMGWGDTKRFKFINFIPDNLQYAEQRVKEGPRCMFYFFGRPIGDAELCAGDNFSGTCNHDSGGPLVLQNSATNNVPVQIGIASYGGAPLCGFLTPSVWFRTSYYNSFIKEAAAGDELCEI